MLCLQVTQELDGIVSKPILEQVTEDIEFITGLKSTRILAKLVGQGRIISAQVKV